MNDSPPSKRAVVLDKASGLQRIQTENGVCPLILSQALLSEACTPERITQKSCSGASKVNRQNDKQEIETWKNGTQQLSRL